ncbi:vitamin K epoxide reductase family protein [Yonghaparkia sp. Root332]|uniref:vitamin K epoxide reductase family protein n=1 Tax=Yonghaparkia sp. Root332 TaxID=1736516 RepID=UPI000ABFC75E|nr:vitamin K epoxide reductase family protein [Yonghaparkia sp. Root332]
MTALDPASVATAAPARRPWLMGAFLLLTGAVGWWGAMALITERVAKLIDPQHVLNCDINPLVSCGSVMESWQASLLGFPNPLLGVAGFVAPMAVGVALLAGARFARWFWALFLAGVAGAWVFVTWLFTQSVYEIGALCPWCMLVWAAVIPLFWWLLAWLLATGRLTGGAGRRVGAAVLPFTWAIVVVNYAVIVLAIIVQFPTLLPSLL